MYIPLEIIIGTVPLTSAVQQYQQTLSAAQPSAPPEAAMRMGLLFLSITIVNFRYPPPSPLVIFLWSGDHTFCLQHFKTRCVLISIYQTNPENLRFSGIFLRLGLRDGSENPVHKPCVQCMVILIELKLYSFFNVNKFVEERPHTLLVFQLNFSFAILQRVYPWVYKHWKWGRRTHSGAGQLHPHLHVL